MGIKLTENAVREVKRIISEMETPQYLRVAVKGGGCGGCKFSLALDDNTTEKDVLDDQDEIKIVVDKRSVLYLDGVILDFYEDASKKGFVFNGGTVKTTCGCGSSMM